MKLFNGQFISHYLENKKKELKESVSNYSLDSLKKESIDLITDRLYQQFNSECPELMKENVLNTKLESIQRNDEWGQPRNIEVQVIYINIPFTGDGNLFFCIPSSSTYVYPEFDNIDIGSKIINAKIVLFNKNDVNEYNSKLSKLKSDLNTNLPQVKKDVETFNIQLKGIIKSLLEDRKKFLDDQDNFLNNIK